MQRVFEGYNKSLRVVDRRTGGQGATPVNPQTVEQVFRAAVEAIVWQAAGEKKIMGANDNTILSNLHAYDQLFEHPKMVAIFRNPIDQALSAGPQIVTRSGRKAVVIVSVEEWDRKTRRKGNLAEFFAASPLRESGLKVRRGKGGLRRTDL